MKKFLAMVLALIMALSLVACGQQGGDAQQGDDSASGDKVIKIGVFEPQSGDNGAGGKQEILGMQYANKMIPTVTIGGEEYKVELVYADNASSNDKAPTAAQTLISQGCVRGAGLLRLRRVHRRRRYLLGERRCPPSA